MEILVQTLKEKQEQDDKYNPAEGRYGDHDDLGVHPERREAEVDDLEKLYNAESREDSEKNTSPGSKSVNQEKSALSKDEPENEEGSKATQEKPRKVRITKKQAAAGGGAAGLLIGGGVGFFVFMSGPLQFIQFSQLLSQFHFSNSERFGNSRTAKIFRYATGRKKGNQNYNMSRLGNKVAIHYEKKLSKAGIEIEYNEKAGRVNKINIDPETPEGKRLIANIEADSGVNLPKDPKSGGKVHLDLATDSSEVSSAKLRRQAVNGAVDAMEMNGVSSALAKRMLKVRSGVNFHPLKNLARSVDERTNLKFKEWKEKIQDEKAQKIQEGSKPPDDIKTSSGKEDPENPPSEQEKVQAGELDNEIKEAQAIARDTSVDVKTRASSIKAKLGWGIGATAVLGIFCGLDAIGDQVSALQEENIIQPLIRTGMDINITGEQIKSGQDTNMEEIGAMSDKLYDKKTNTSWMSAESIQTELGHPGVGTKMDDATKPGKERPAFFEVINNITGVPGISQACSAMSSVVGSFLVTAGGLAVSFTGIGGLALQVGSEVVQQVASNAFMDDLVRALAGPAISIAKATGGTLGNYANFGAFLANNNTMAGMGGRSLTPSESIALANETRNEILQQNKQKTLYARIFDVKDANSLISKGVIQNTSLYDSQTAIASIVQSPLHFIRNISSSIIRLNPKVSAQTSVYDYGVEEIGFSISERESSMVDDPYANADIVEPHLAELNEKYGKVCFGTTIEPSTGKITYEKAPSYSDREKNKNICGSSNKDEMFLRYRMFVADNITINSIACYESIDETSCQNIALENKTSTSTNTTPVASSNSTCAEGSRSIGQVDGYANGTKQVITLCAIDELPIQAIDGDSAESIPRSKYYINGAENKAIVSSSISSQIVAMVRKARSEGVNLVAISSFRTNEHQTEACKPRGGKCGNSGYNMPGMSVHQSGEAIDFLDSNRNSTANCRNNMMGERCVGTDPTWNWLSKNAESFGLKQLPKESWHWSTSGN